MTLPGRVTDLMPFDLLLSVARLGSLGLAAREHGRYLDADTRPEVEATWDRQRAFAGGAIALSALSAATVGLYFVF